MSLDTQRSEAITDREIISFLKKDNGSGERKASKRKVLESIRDFLRA